MPELSVIVPVYKAEAFLRKCIDSILTQSFRDFELLLIDDGSPDGSGKLCDRIAAEDVRIRVFHKENGGVSSARNLGMQEAVGRLIAFVDADDWLEEDAFEVLHAHLERAQADTVGCAHYRTEVNGDIAFEPGALPLGVYGKEEIKTGILDRLLGERLGKPGEVLNGFIWRFLFSRSIIVEHDIQFSGAYLEDELFLMEYFCHAEKLAMTDRSLYYYLQNPSSVTRNYLPNYMQTFRDFMEAKEVLVEKYGLRMQNWRENSNWSGLLIAVGNEFAPGNPASFGEKKRHVEAMTGQHEMSRAIRTITPKNLGKNKQMVVKLIRKRRFFLLTLLYTIKNRGR